MKTETLALEARINSEKEEQMRLQEEHDKLVNSKREAEKVQI